MLFSCGEAFFKRSEGADGPMTVTSNPISDRGVESLRREAEMELTAMDQSNGLFDGAFLTWFVNSVSTSSLEEQ